MRLMVFRGFRRFRAWGTCHKERSSTPLPIRAGVTWMLPNHAARLHKPSTRTTIARFPSSPLIIRVSLFLLLSLWL